MPAWPSDYIEKVVEDVEKYNGIRKVIKAGLIERCMTRFCAPEKLHPNPADEFSRAEIGPNLEIVGEYVTQIKFLEAHRMDVFDDPVIVEKMEPDGYLLLNGHHRWFAALRMNVKKLHVKIVNIITDIDLGRMIGASANDKLVTFDFDEVLLTIDENNMATLSSTIFSKKIKERLRTGAPEVIRVFQNKGYDICVYTSGYFTEEDFNDFFSMYDLKADVIVNGVNEKRKAAGSADRIKQLLKENYKRIVHVDNESVYDVDHVTKEFETYEIKDFDLSWDEGVKDIIDKL